MHVGVGIHPAGDGACFSASLYDGHGHPFLRLRDGTHSLAVGPVKPWPLIQARQIRPAAPAGARKTGTRPTDRFPRQPEAASADSEVRPGPRLPALRAHRLKIREAAPEALPTLSLPTLGGLLGWLLIVAWPPRLASYGCLGSGPDPRLSGSCGRGLVRGKPPGTTRCCKSAGWLPGMGARWSLSGCGAAGWPGGAAGQSRRASAAHQGRPACVRRPRPGPPGSSTVPEPTAGGPGNAGA